MRGESRLTIFGELFIMTQNRSGINTFTGEKIKAIANKFNQRFFLRPLHILDMMKTVYLFTNLLFF
jgi:hypothetical protein